MNKRKTIPTQKTHVSHLAVNDFFRKETIGRTMELCEHLNLPIFKRNQTEISHRFLNWWTKENVLDKNIEEAGRFTFTEFIWIKVVEQLRLFNLPLPFIATLKSKLFVPIKTKGVLNKLTKAKSFISELAISEEEKKKLLGFVIEENKAKEENSINLFQVIIVESILNRKPIGLAIFPDCEFLIVDKTKQFIYSQNDLKLLDNANYIKLSISNLLSEFLKSELAFATMVKIQLLTYSENKLYEVIHTGEYENIVVHFKDKKQKPLDLKNTSDTQQKIIDILSEGEFLDITVKKSKGVVTRIEQPLKIAF